MIMPAEIILEIQESLPPVIEVEPTKREKKQ
jgi:hypothetical protein